MRKWEKQQAKDNTEWWPKTHEDVSTWVSTLAKLPPTPDGEVITWDI